MLRKVVLLTLLSAVFFFPRNGSAQARIRISKEMNAASLLDISGFKSKTEGAPALFRQTLESDLCRSGWFVFSGAGSAEYAIGGEAGPDGSSLAVRCEVYHVSTRERYFGKSYKAPEADARKLAHRVADDIVFALTGQPGMAATRILLAGNRTGSKEIYLCDADGQNLRQITSDKALSLFPKWGPDAGQFVYTSDKSLFFDIYLVNLSTGNRRCIANFPGLNSGATISPDGREAAMTLSKDGNPDLFVMDINSGRLTRLTSTRHAAEASPSWSPDGRQIVFVSDRAGAPQLYITDRKSGESKRITVSGGQNVDPDWGANGFIAYGSLIGKLFQVFVLNPASLETQPIQISREDAAYEDPAWAPDGRHIVCTRTQNYRSRIFIIDTMSPSCISLLPDSEKGDWCSPDWSPK